MSKYFTSAKNIRQVLPQVIFVFAAFFVMVLIGSIFGGIIISRNVASYGKEVVNTTGERINAYLDEHRVILDNVAFSLTLLKDEGRGVPDMLASIEAWSEKVKGSNKKYENFSGFYGVVDGEFVDGSGWDPMNPESEDYDPDYWPLSRPWHLGAMGAKGEVFFSDPYIDADTGEYVLTASKMLAGSDGRSFGVIAMDFFLGDIEEIVNSLTLMDSGYGVLLDSERKIIVTANYGRIGTYFDYIDEAHAQIGKSLDEQGGIVHSEVVSDGGRYIVFFKQLPSNWYLGIASLKENYYSDRNLMIVVLSLAGFLMALPLSLVLIVLHIRKLRADEASELKTSFLANMSHEIRTPMNAIIGMTELLQNENLSEQQESYIKDINSSAGALLSIINDILDLSKIEAGKIDLRPVDYDFDSFIDNIVSMFTFVTEEKGIDFRFEKNGDMPGCLYGDDIRLRQVLTNLCGNAVKFTNEGYVGLSVTAHGNEIVFVIKDSGLGIRKEDLPKLWSPFEQFDMQNNRKIIGTGLGLPISKNIVEMMGGSINAESIYGSGTTFTVRIPAVPGNMDNVLHVEAGEEPQPFIAPDARVLIVDDNEVNLKVASGLLRSLYKIEAQTAPSGKDAIELVKAGSYDVVFMDHMMPEMDGIQTVNAIRKLSGISKDMKFIALTANAIAGVKEMFIENGFDGFVSKPINTADLHAVLLKVLPPSTLVTTASAAGVVIPIAGSSEPFRNAVNNALDNAIAAARMASGIADSEATANPVIAAPEPQSPADARNDEGGGSGFMAALGKIDSINAEIALSRVSGFEDMLEETVELFYGKLPLECSRLEEFNKNGDMKNFAISVHGLKSALSAIGAMELSETAFELEKASKGGQASFCSDNLPGFIGKLRALQEQLAGIFDGDNNGEESGKLKVESGKLGAKDEGDPELLNEKVQQAIGACDDFDDGAALEALEPLLKLDYGADKNALLKTAAAAIKDFDYDSASETLNKLMG